MLHAESSLQHATDKAGRLIRTGQVTTRSGATLMSAETFIERLCGEATILKNCTEELSIDVQSEASFAELSSSMPSPLAVGPSEPDGSPVREFSPGGASKATSLVVTYDWPLSLSTIIPFGNIHDGSAQRLQAIAIFRNEPY
jgi:Flp pilus assembly protein TadG